MPRLKLQKVGVVNPLVFSDAIIKARPISRNTDFGSEQNLLLTYNYSHPVARKSDLARFGDFKTAVNELPRYGS
jgi:hypothetical protein